MLHQLGSCYFLTLQLGSDWTRQWTEVSCPLRSNQESDLSGPARAESNGDLVPLKRRATNTIPYTGSVTVAFNPPLGRFDNVTSPP
jgi:hypothetical protein